MYKRAIFLIGLCILVGCAQVDNEHQIETTQSSATPPGIPTSTPMPLPSLSPTATEKPTATPTKTPTPTATPFGGSNFLYRGTTDGALVLSGEGIIYTQEDFKRVVGKEYNFFFFSPSKDLKYLGLIGMKQTDDGWVRDYYISTFDLQNIQQTEIYPAYLVDEECPKYFVYSEDSTIIYLQNIDGTEIVKLPKRSDYDGYPFWSHDCSYLYWTRNDILRTIDTNTGKSQPYDTDAISQLKEQLGWFYISDVYYSPTRERIVYDTGDDVILSNNDFTMIEILFRLDDYLINRITWSPNGEFLAMTSEVWRYDEEDEEDYVSYYLHIYEFKTKVLKSYEFLSLGINPEYRYAESCGFTPDQKNILINTESEIYFYNLQDETIVKKEFIGRNPSTWCPVWVLPDSPVYQQILSMVKP